MERRLIGFDVDGTLVDSLSQSYEVDCNLIRTHGGKVPTLQEYRNAITDGNWEAFYQSFGVTSPVDDEEYYKALKEKPLKEVEGAKSLLEYFTRRWKNISLFVVSINSSKSDVIRKLDVCELTPFFQEDSIYAVKGTKTDAIRQEIEKRGISPNKTFYVGDTVKDIVESREAGVHPVGLLLDTSFNSYTMINEAKPDYHPRRYGELADLAWEKTE